MITGAKPFIVLLLSLLLVCPSSVLARGGGHSGNHGGHGSHSGHHSSGGHHSDGGGKSRSGHKKSSGKKRKRSKGARDAFMRQHPCPANGHTSGACPGYVVNHVVPLKRGGADDPSNMQWQTVQEGKAKDKWE